MTRVWKRPEVILLGLSLMWPAAGWAQQRANASTAPQRAALLPAATLRAEAKPAQVRSIAVSQAEDAVRVEISASGPLKPRTMRVADPDRIVIDLPGSTPGPKLLPVAVHKGGIATIRVGLFREDPPTTRVVLDISRRSEFEVFTEGTTIVVNVHRTAAAPLTALSEIASPVQVAVQPNAAMDAEATRAEVPVTSAPVAGSSVPPKVSPAAPAPTAVASLLVTKVAIDDSQILTAAEIRAVTSRYEQKRATQADLTQMIAELNRLYAAKGYTTAKAVLPPQTVRDGIVTVRLVEGRVGKLQVMKDTHTNESYFLNRVPTSSGDILRQKDVQGALSYFNATNDVKMRAVLQPGEQFGRTDVVLQTDGPSDLSVTAFSDNAGRDNIGLYRGGLNATYRSLFGNRDPLALGFLGADGTLGGNASYSLPLGTRGARVAATYNYNTIALNGGVMGSTGLVGYSYDAALRLSRPLLVRPSLTWSASLAAHYKASALSSEGYALSHTAIRSLELTTDFQRFDSRGSWSFSNAFNGGLDNLVAGQDFFRYNGAIARLFAFSPNVAAILRASGQLSALHQLAPIEQMQIGGSATVRGYPESSLIGDRGYAATAELNFPFVPGAWARQRLKAATFFDDGAVFDQGYNSSTKPNDRKLMSVGFGFILKFTNFMSGRVDFGVPMRNKLGIPDVGVHFSMQSTFDFPHRPNPPLQAITKAQPTGGTQSEAQ